MLIRGITPQQIVHIHNRGKEVAILNAGHPADQELLVGSGAREQGFGFRQGRRVWNAPA